MDCKNRPSLSELLAALEYLRGAAIATRSSASEQFPVIHPIRNLDGNRASCIAVARSRHSFVPPCLCHKQTLSGSLDPCHRRKSETVTADR